jgi:hypothetical protein
LEIIQWFFAFEDLFFHKYSLSSAIKVHHGMELSKKKVGSP